MITSERWGNTVNGKTYFYSVFVDPQNRKFMGNVCPDCRHVRLNRWQKWYGRTKTGFLVNSYANIKRRCHGLQNKFYKGLPYPSKKSFYEWANSSEQFHVLFDAYEKSGFKTRLAPSVDRINPALGYLFENIRWVTLSENAKRACLGLDKKPHEKIHKARALRDLGWSYSKIAKDLEVHPSTARKYILNLF